MVEGRDEGQVQRVARRVASIVEEQLSAGD
jgi:hypothetical protein